MMVLYKSVKEWWVDALFSGDFTQGTGALCQMVNGNKEYLFRFDS